MAFKKILLKLSGEVLSRGSPYGIQEEACRELALALRRIRLEGIELGVVIGGGNICRGINLHGKGMERTSADQMGMLATLLNGIAVRESLAEIGMKARVMSAIDCPKIVESYNRDEARKASKDGDILLFVGGTGNPYFTTDTAAALRACEFGADALLKATKVDGIYDKDPVKHGDAVKYDEISYAKVIADGLGVMDTTAVVLCQTNRIPIFVFKMNRLLVENVTAQLSDPSHGTLVRY